MQLAEQANISFSGHASVHHENLQQMQDTFDIMQGGMSDPVAFLRYVDFWFQRHIIQFDKAFAQTLKAISSGQVIE